MLTMLLPRQGNYLFLVISTSMWTTQTVWKGGDSWAPSGLNLEQHVNSPTHTKGHTLYLIITRTSETVVAQIQTHAADECELMEVMLQIYMFVFNPRWDMHSIRAKEIKDSPNSQAVPKILVLLKNGTVWFHTGSG